MRAVVLGLHLLAAGAWLGCVLTEALFERALLGRGPGFARVLARLHWRVDTAVEVPLLAVVALTGTWLWVSARAAVDALLACKIALGLLAVLANGVCVRLVRQRLRQAEAGDWAAFARTDHAQHRWGAWVLLGLLGAWALGLARWW